MSLPEDWPVLPDGVEGVLHLRVPPDEEPEAEDCFVCARPMDDFGPTAPAWYIPGEGFAHGHCYEAEDG